MAWPTNINSVTCIDFPKSYLPALRSAIEHKMVECGKPSLFAGSCGVDFHWAGCDWHLTEDFEIINSISLLRGKPEEEDLTLATLKGYKIQKT
jgi:hypothetical protein